jgi:hypothetical protein
MVNSQKISKRLVGGDGIIDSASNMFSGAIDRVRNTYTEYRSTILIGFFIAVVIAIIFIVIFVPKPGGSGSIDETVYAKDGFILTGDITGQPPISPDGNVILLPEPDKYVDSNSFTVFMQLCVNNINTNLIKDRNILMMPNEGGTTGEYNNKYYISRDASGVINSSSNTYTDTDSNYYLRIYLSKFKNDIIVSFKRLKTDTPTEITISNVPILKWFSIAVCRNDTTLHVYVDGKPYKTKYISSTSSTEKPGRAHPIYIGKGIKLDRTSKNTDTTTFDTLDGVIASIVVNNSAKPRDVIESYHKGLLPIGALMKPTLIKEQQCSLESAQ